MEGRLAEWRRLLRSSTTQGRAVLQRGVRGRITFTPRADGQGYDFAATTRFDRLFTGVAVPTQAYIKDGDVRGAEHISPEDTPDVDYGRLLERAAEKTVRSSDPLRSRGVIPERGPVSEGRGRHAIVRDPDGRAVILTEVD